MLLYAPNWLFLLPGASLVVLALLIVFWLLPGPRSVSPHVILDIHTMIFGAIFTLLGVQILSIGTFAKVFSYAERFDRNTVSLKRVLKRFTLESGLLLGGALFLAGFAGCAWVTWQWAASGFGPLAEVRQVLFWSMWLFIGVQIVFGSRVCDLGCGLEAGLQRWLIQSSACCTRCALRATKWRATSTKNAFPSKHCNNCLSLSAFRSLCIAASNSASTISWSPLAESSGGADRWLKVTDQAAGCRV
jgi:hypothetical protein